MKRLITMLISLMIIIVLVVLQIISIFSFAMSFYKEDYKNACYSLVIYTIFACMNGVIMYLIEDYIKK